MHPNTAPRFDHSAESAAIEAADNFRTLEALFAAIKALTLTACPEASSLAAIGLSMAGTLKDDAEVLAESFDTAL